MDVVTVMCRARGGARPRANRFLPGDGEVADERLSNNDSQGRAVQDAVVKVTSRSQEPVISSAWGTEIHTTSTASAGPRHYTWHGQALAILRPAKWPGGLMLTASADGLRPARLTLGVKPGRD
jgi:hypothetical protein